MLESVLSASAFAGGGAGPGGMAGVAAIGFQLSEADHAWVR